MGERILAALLDLRTVLSELQGVCTNLDQAVCKLMAVELEALEAKSGEVLGESPSDKKEGSWLGGKLWCSLIALLLKLRRHRIKI